MDDDYNALEDEVEEDGYRWEHVIILGMIFACLVLYVWLKPIHGHPH